MSSSVTSSQIVSSEISSSQGVSIQVSSVSASSQASLFPVESSSTTSSTNSSVVISSPNSSQISSQAVSSEAISSSLVSSQAQSSAISSQDTSSLANSNASSTVISSLVSSSEAISFGVSSQNLSSQATSSFAQSSSSMVNYSLVSVSSSQTVSSVVFNPVTSLANSSKTLDLAVSSADSSQISNLSNSSATSLSPVVSLSSTKDITKELVLGTQKVIVSINSECKSLDSLQTYPDKIVGYEEKFVEFKVTCSTAKIKTIWQNLDPKKNYKFVKYDVNTKKVIANYPATIIIENGQVVSYHSVQDNTNGDSNGVSGNIWDPYTLVENSPNDFTSLVAKSSVDLVRTGGERSIFYGILAIILSFIGLRITSKKIKN